MRSPSFMRMNKQSFFQTLTYSVVISILAFTVSLLSATTSTCTDLTSNNGGGNWNLCYLYNDAGDQLTLIVTATPIEAGGWIGFGINPNSGIMPGAEVVIGVTDGTTAGSWIGNYQTMAYYVAASTGLGLTGATVTQVAGGRTQLEFTFPVANSAIDSSGNANIIFARGPHPASSNAGDIMQHTDPSGLGNLASFNFKTGAVSIDDTPKKYRAAHGFMMAFAWGLFIPLGVMCARYFRPYYDPMWFYMHRTFMSIGFALAFSAWMIGLVKIYDNNHPTHRAIGITAMSLLCAQMIIGNVRPHPPKAGEEPTQLRKMWALLHHTVGRCAFTLAIINCFIGLSYFNETKNEINNNTIAFLVCFLFVMAVFIALEIRHQMFPGQAPFARLLGWTPKDASISGATGSTKTIASIHLDKTPANQMTVHVDQSP